MYWGRESVRTHPLVTAGTGIAGGGMMRDHTPQVDWLTDPVAPMLAKSCGEPFCREGWSYEVKWDGIRALIAVDEGQVRIRSRSQRDITACFPELCQPDEAFRVSQAVFDGEIVCLDDGGRPILTDVVGRLQARGDQGIERSRARHPAVCYLFDCLYLDGRPMVQETLSRRRQWLARVVEPGSAYRLSEPVVDGAALFEAVRSLGLEGIMAKRNDSLYLPGRRSDSWLKVKVHHTMECLILGYAKGRGNLEGQFRALHLGRSKGGTVEYLGKVGTGFDGRSSEAVARELEGLKKVDIPIATGSAHDASEVWLEPKLFCEVQYASLTSTGKLREAVFLHLRPDLTPD